MPKSLGVIKSSAQVTQEQGTSKKEGEIICKEISKDTGGNECETIHISLAKSINCPYVACTVNQVMAHACVDTGASRTLISEELFKKLKGPFAVSKPITMVLAEKDQQMQARQIGPVNIALCNGSEKIELVVYVANIADDVLLGYDALKALKAIVDASTDEIRFKNSAKSSKLFRAEEAKLQSTGVMQVRKVTLKNAITVPAWSEAVVRVSCPPCGSSITFFEPNNIQEGMLSGTVCQGSEWPIINVLNLSDQKIHIPRGTDIGSLHPIEEVQNKQDPSFYKEEEGYIKVVTPIAENNDGVPAKLQNLWKDLDEDESLEKRSELKALLLEYQDIFGESDMDLGTFNAIHHEIITTDDMPVKQPMRRTPLHFQAEEDKVLQEMLDAGVIRPSTSAWASCPILVRKKDGRLRYAIDFRQVNKKTVKDVYPLPLLGECMDALEGNQFFSALDANSAFWQVPMHPKSKEITAFRTRRGLYEFNVLPFGLCNSPSTYMRVMDLVLNGLTWQIALCFLDDICVLGKNASEHLENLRQVFKRFRTYGLKLKARKCCFFKKSIEFLGRKVGRNGVTLTDRSIETIKSWKPPSNHQELQRLNGMANFHRQFIPNYAEIVEPLLLMGRQKKFDWGGQQQQAFENLKEALISPQVLQIPRKEGLFILDCDASDYAIGAEVWQVQDGVEVVIAYGSHTLTPSQRKYCTTRKELLAVVKFTEDFKHYLTGRPFLVRTDHASLLWLHRFRNIDGQIARWAEALARFDMEIQHRPGKLHANADALSRLGIAECLHFDEKIPLTELPCGGCTYCKKMEEKWGYFLDQVDNIVPLTQRSSSTVKKVSEGVNSQCACEHYRTWIHGHIRNVQDDICKMDDLIKEQEADADLSFLRHWLMYKKEPIPLELSLANETAKYYYVHRDLFLLKDGVIYMRKKFGDRLVIPQAMKAHILSICHDIPTAGHFGVERTMQKVKESFAWYKCSQEVKKYVRKCQTCNRAKKTVRHKRFPMTLNPAGVVLERVHVDYMGPLPKSRRGNQYILVAVDHFTRWLEIIPTPTQDAETTAKALVDVFFCRWGLPLRIISDQGTNFDSALIKEMCRLLRIEKCRTTAYRPQANGAVERLNKIIMAAIRSYIGTDETRWDENLQLIASAMRAARNRHTGQSPNKMMLGRETNTPIDLMYPIHKGSQSSPDNYVDALESELQRAHQTAREHLKSEIVRMKKDYDLNAKVWTFKKGDVVLLLNRGTKKGECSKLQMPWKEQGIIVKVLSPCLYKVQIGGWAFKVCHHDSMKVIYEDKETLPKWMQKVMTSLETGQPVIYCYCKQPDDGQLYIECHICQDWFHPKCAGLRSTSQAVRKRFVCKECR